MNRPWRVFVLTAYSGENERELAFAKLQAQTNVEIDHFVVNHKPILEAFNTLYQKWESVKHDYDFVLQLDADMVFKHNAVLQHYGDLLFQHPKYNVLTSPVFDFFTYSNIWAIHCYKPSIKFNVLKDKYQPDEEYDKTARVRVPGITLNTKALVDHAPLPSLSQSFHFGWHRELRVRVKRGQRDNITKLDQARKKYPHPMRDAAWAGVLAARQYIDDNDGDFSPIEYQAEGYKQALHKYKEQIGDKQ